MKRNPNGETKLFTKEMIGSYCLAYELNKLIWRSRGIKIEIKTHTRQKHA